MNMRVIDGGRSHSLDQAVADVSNGGHDAEGVLVYRDSVNGILRGGWDTVAIGDSVEETVRARLHALAATLDPTAEVLEVYGPGTQLARLDRA